MQVENDGVIALEAIISICFGLDTFIRYKYFHNTYEQINEVDPEVIADPTSREKTRKSRLSDFSTPKSNRAWNDRLLLGVEIIASFPFSLFLKSRVLPFLRLFKFVRTRESFEVVLFFFERKLILSNAGLQRLLIMGYYFLLLTHFIASMFFFIGVQEANGSGTSWAVNDNLIEFNESIQSFYTSDIQHAYTRSIYWATVTLVTVGFGDIVPDKGSMPETLFTVITMYLGMITSCFIIGNLTNFVARLDASEDEFQQKMDTLRRYMLYRKLPTSLIQRVSAYYGYLWQSLKGIDESQFLSLLPSRLKVQVAGLRTKVLLKNILFLKDLKDVILNKLVVLLDQIIYQPGEFIVKQKHSINGVYFLTRGEADVMQSDERSVMRTISAKQESHFGENGLLENNQFEESIRAKTYCELYLLSQESFESVVSLYLSGDEIERMKEIAAKSAKQNAKLKKFFGLTEEPPKLTWFYRLCQPDSKFRELWNLFLLFTLLYTYTILPVRVAFSLEEGSSSPGWPEYTFDAFIPIDIVFRARYFAFKREGIIINQQMQITEKYLNSGLLWWDIITCLPLELLQFQFPAWKPFLRLNRMARVIYVLEYYETIVAILARAKIVLQSSIHRIVKIFVFILFFVHWVACFWVYTARLTFYLHEWRCGDEAECRSDWISNDILNWDLDHSQPMVTYVRAIYFVIVDMTTVGYGDIVPLNSRETLVAFFVTVIGGFLYPAIVGAMAALLSTMNANEAHFLRDRVKINTFLERSNTPESLRKRINQFYDYLWSRQRGVNEERILSELPKQLRMAVQESINGRIIRSVEFFQDISEAFLKNLLGILRPRIYLPNDRILLAGELGKDMFLLERGAVKVVSKDLSVTFAIISEGSYFGEVSLLQAQARSATIISLNYCDCFLLDRNDFHKVAKSFPLEKKRVLETLRQVWTKKRLINIRSKKNLEKFEKLVQLTSSQNQTKEKETHSPFRTEGTITKQLWNLFVLIGILYNIVLIPARMAFLVSPILYLVDILLDILFLIDAYLRATYFVKIIDGKPCTERDELWSVYSKSSDAVLDSLITLPLEVLLVITTAIGLSPINIWPWLRIFKFLQVMRLPIYARSLDKLLINFGLGHLVSYNLLKLGVVVFMVSHIFACGFHALRFATVEPCNHNISFEYEGVTIFESSCPASSLLPGQVVDPNTAFFAEGQWWMKTSDMMEGYSTLCEKRCGSTFSAYCKYRGTWVEHQMQNGLISWIGGSELERYLRAIYWAIPTLVVVVIGDSIPATVLGTIYVFVVILFGVVVNGNIIGNIGNLVANLEGDYALYQEKMDTVDNFLNLHELSFKIQLRLHNYYEYVFGVKQGIKEDEILKQLPTTLRQEICSKLRLGLLVQCPLFERCNLSFVKSLSLILVNEVYSPGDFILNEGDLGDEMFFIKSGTVKVMKILKRSDSRDRKSRRMSTYNVPYHRLSATGIDNINENGSIPPKSLLVEIGSLSNGEYFGEFGMFTKQRRGASVLSIDYSELLILSSDELDEVLQRFPQESNKIYVMLRKLIQGGKIAQSNILKNYKSHLGKGKKLLRMLNFQENILQLNNVLNQQHSRKISSNKLNRHSRKQTIEAMSSISYSMSYRKTSEKIVPETRKKRSSTRIIIGRIRKDQSIIFTPHCSFMQLWDTVCFLGSVYFLLVVPYRFVFYVPGIEPIDIVENRIVLSSEIVAWFSLDYFVLASIAIDKYLRSHYIAIQVAGKLLNNSAEIAKEYNKHWKYTDMITLLPLELSILLIPEDSLFGNQLTNFCFLQLIRLTRLFHIFEYTEKLSKQISIWWPESSNSLREVIKFTLYIFLMNHVCACLWFFIHRFLEHDSHITWALVDGLATFNSTTGFHNIIDSSKSSFFCYLRSFYFTITTMSSVGYGDIRPYTTLETVFEIFVVLGGACLFAAIIGIVAFWCNSIDSTGFVHFKHKMYKYKKYMDYREIPNELQVKVLRHFTSLWQKEKGIKLSDLQKDIPLPLQLELAAAVNKNVLESVKGFMSCSTIVQQRIANKLMLQICPRGHFVYVSQEFGEEIYFIHSGSVLVHDKKNNNKFALSVGEHFGQSILYSENAARTEDVYCTSESVFYYLERNDIEQIILDFPDHLEVGIFRELFRAGRKSSFQKKITVQELEQMSDRTKHKSQLQLIASSFTQNKKELMNVEQDAELDAFNNVTNQALSRKQWEMTRTTSSSRRSLTIEDVKEQFDFMKTKGEINQESPITTISGRPSSAPSKELVVGKEEAITIEDVVDSNNLERTIVK